jgi:hypothetical protein
MRNLVTKLALVVATVATSFSGMASADTYGLQVGLGYRQDSLQWQIKDLGQVNPHSKSNIHFKDLEIVLLGAKFKGMLGCSVYNRTSFDYGWIVDGNVREEVEIYRRDNVNHFDHRGVIAEGSYNKAVIHNKEKSNSYVWDFNIGFGIPYQCFWEGFQIAPMIGFAYDREQIKVHNKEQIHADFSHSHPRVTCGGNEHCHGSNTYRASWWGPYLGFDFSYTTDNCWNVFGEFEVHLGSAERHRSSLTGVKYFDHYDRSKFFWGTTTRLGTNYIVCENWYVEAALAYTYWTSNNHRDYLRISSGSLRVDVGYLF